MDVDTDIQVPVPLLIRHTYSSPRATVNMSWMEFTSVTKKLARYNGSVGITPYLSIYLSIDI